METYKFNSVLFHKVQDFPKKGVNFIDITPTYLNKFYLNLSILVLTGTLPQFIPEGKNGLPDVDYVISPDARGFILGMPIALSIEVPFVPVRKRGKLPKECVMDSIDYNTEYSTTSLDLPIINEDIKDKKFLFVDDVFATGGTYEACKQMIERHGGIMLEPLVVLDLKMSNYTVHSLIDIDNVNNAKEFTDKNDL